MRWERISVVWQPTIVLDFIRHMSAPNSFPRTCTLEALQWRWVLWLLTWRSFVGLIYCSGANIFHEALSDDLLNWAAMVCGAQVNTSPEKAAHHGRRLTLPLLPTTVIAAVRTLSLPHSPWAMPEDGLDVLQTVLTAAAAVASAAARANVTVRYADGAF